MSAEYRFLRFEIVGLATIIFLIIGLLPMFEASYLTSTVTNLNSSLAIVAGLFLLSLPLGYWEHQLVVNVYRSQKKSRAVFKVLKDEVLRVQSKKGKEKPFFDKFDSLSENSFLTALLDLCIYLKESSIDSQVSERLSERWSHFYARRAVGKYAPLISFLLWGITLVLAYLVKWPLVFLLPNFATAFVAWAGIFAFSVLLIDSYSKKIWLEISFLETSLILANQDKIDGMISNVVSRMIEHPEYIEKGESYGMSLYKL